MAGETRALVLEVSLLENKLQMSIFDNEESSITVKNYTYCFLSLDEVKKICLQVTDILNKSNLAQNPDSYLAAGLKKIGQVLWDLLLTRQVKDVLKSSADGNLVLCLDEELISIPWELLYDGEQFLGLKFSVGRLIKTRHPNPISKYRNLNDQCRVLILADPTGDLPSAYKEGRSIKDKLQSKEGLHVDFKSSHIDKLYIKKNLYDYDIVHFAGHCEYDGQLPDKTGWILEDGVFSCADILSMGQGLALPTMIFANGCESARVQKDFISRDYQEKTYSLAAAFLFSGVRHYLGAIHRVEDSIGLNFAKEFYFKLLSGKSVGQALKSAKTRLLELYGRDCLFWADYILYGDPSFIIFKKKKFLPYLAAKYQAAKRFLGLFLAIMCGLILIFGISNLKPRNQILYLRAKQFLDGGNNARALDLGRGIINNDPDFSVAYPLVAEALDRLGRRQEAIRYYFEYALKSFKKGDSKDVANAYVKIGWIYHKIGDYSNALDFYNKAIEMSREHNDKFNQAVGLRKLAVWYLDKQDNDKALELLTKSSEINREHIYLPDYNYNLACDYFDMALLFSNKNDFETAKEFYLKSLEAFKKIKNESELSDCYFNLGEICLFNKEYDKALDYYFKGIDIDTRQNNIPNLISDYNMLGELYLAINDFSKAEEYFKTAENKGIDVGSDYDLASIYYNLGMLYKKTGKMDKSRHYFTLSCEKYKAIDTPDYSKAEKELKDLEK